MIDDIVTRLRDQAQAPALAWLTEAADEIERLRTAGNALAAAHFDDLCDCSDAECVAIIDAHAAWEEARRG